MKRLLLLFFLIISCNQPNGVSVDPETYLLPYPNQIFIQKNTINLSKGLKVSNGIYSSYLKDQLLLNNVPYDKGVKVIFEKSNLDTLGEEGYQLIAKNNKRSILSNTKAGTFYGIQTLLQLTKLEVVQELENYR